jgi:hypothetical protein
MTPQNHGSITSYASERVPIHISPLPLSRDTETAQQTAGDPHVNAQLRSHLSITPSLGWDVSAYFVDRLEFLGVPSYLAGHRNRPG